MVSTIEIKPMPALQPYVRCYAFRSFDTLGADIVKPIYAMYEFYMTFFLKGVTLVRFQTFKTATFNNNDSWILGLQTRYKGNIVFNGQYSVFTIQFTSNGFHNIFGFPLNLVTDQIHNCEDFFGKSIYLLHEQLHESKNIQQMAWHTESFLLKFLIKRKLPVSFKRINFASSLILHYAGNVNIKQLAYHTNMSLRRLEINFIEQVGVPPKLFARITRFNKAINLKLIHPDNSWTCIAYKCNYHDQMHLIKDFKTFGGKAPLSFFKHTPPPKEEFINIVTPS